MISDIYEDIASLEEWFFENEECFIIPYIEKNFKEVSFDYEFDFMKQHLFFTKIIIEDNAMTNDQKLRELYDNVSRGKSKIVIVVGMRGQGKTATGMLLLEELYNKALHNRFYYVGKPSDESEYPKWLKFCDDLDNLPNNSIAIIDEAVIKYSARRSMSGENVSLTEKMVILRHKGCTLIFMAQNLRMADTNIDRLADIIIYKKANKYGNEKDKESEDIQLIRQRLKPRTKSQAMIEYRLSGKFRSITHKLPSFWNEETISKSFKEFKKEDKKEVNKALIQSPY
jgi:hypothetical protein